MRDVKDTRGSRWCPTCSELVSRDRDACKNIFRVYEAEDRPRFYAERGERTKVLPEVKSHTPPITKGNSLAEGKKKKESDFCPMEREKKQIHFQNSIQKDR
jgi:hypothetical protein